MLNRCSFCLLFILELKKIEDKSWEIKRELTARVKQQLRRMPVLKFFIDDTLDYVFKMDEILKNL